jgi:hypothetical protein
MNELAAVMAAGVLNVFKKLKGENIRERDASAHT